MIKKHFDVSFASGNHGKEASGCVFCPQATMVKKHLVCLLPSGNHGKEASECVFCPQATMVKKHQILGQLISKGEVMKRIVVLELDTGGFK